MGWNTTDRILLATLVMLFAGFLYTIRNSFEPRIIEKGDTAPQFTVTTDSGKRITRSDFGGKLLVLNFWATWCPPCIAELPSLNRFAQEYSKEGIVVLGISVDKNEQVYRSFMKQNPLSFETARDPDAEIPAEYGTFKWPETYIINKDGKVVEKLIADQDWLNPQLVAAIRRHL